ncbi:hypothetical protein CSOJ01_13166 [Colletotrichum sojae]|uniref:NAD dependent epimerase/dehydratase family protein n=1 Tax=Colletotrichum sojae TaxID=2175907 RepID=A0A8H6IT17_9PEZI|nr:hypothetical protein CSOJ01_13166 [Colletotrichum sojae]
MSKEDDLPPSYDSLITPPPPSVSSTLTSLTSLLRTTQAQQSALDTLTTTSLLPLLTPHLTSLLTRLGTTPHPPALAELVLVPAAAVGPAWQISSDADRQAGEVVQLVRVAREPSPDSKESGGGGKESQRDAPPRYDAGSSSSASRGFDDWGRWDDDTSASSAKEDEWWWDDEALARRLAKRLQPEPNIDRTVVRARVEQVKEEKKASRWGLFRGSSEASSSSAPAPAPPHSPARQQDDVSMTVRAEEVTFRRENEMGIWEGMRGWSIVARVRIRR